MEQPKKVLITHHSPIIGGAEKSLLDFLDVSASDNRFHFYVACPKGFGLSTEIKKIGIGVIEIPFMRLKRTFNLFALLKYFISIINVTYVLCRVILKKNIDILHANSTTACLFTLFAAKFCRIPLIWHIRDTVKHKLPESLLAKYADFMIAISFSAAANLLNHNNCKIKIIFNGTKIKKFDSNLIDKTIETDESQFLLTIAQLIPWKRHDLIIDAMRILTIIYPDLKLLLVGGDMFSEQDDYVFKLKSKIKEYGLDYNIFLCGYKENVSEIIMKSTLLVHPADNEPLGRVVVEAMALGKVVVASNSGGIPEYIDDRVNGYLFQPGNVDDLVFKIIMALNFPTNILSKNAGNTAKNYFDLETQASKIRKVYNDLLNL